MPSPETFIPSQLFREAKAAHLCLPSPCCQGHIGKPTGYRGIAVDPFGDAVMCATLPFDTWRHRHDDIKWAIVAWAHKARVEAEAEVFGLFCDIVPAAALGEGGAARDSEGQKRLHS